MPYDADRHPPGPQMWVIEDSERREIAALEAERDRLQAAVNNGVAVRFQPDTDTYIAHDDGPYLVVRAALEEGGDG